MPRCWLFGLLLLVEVGCDKPAAATPTLGPLPVPLAYEVARQQRPDPYADLGDFPVKSPDDKIDMKSEPPPEGAVVLFDGKSLEGWTKVDGKSPATWKLLPGGAMQAQGGSIISKQPLAGDFHLHVEFRVPYVPQAKGQMRGNSGVYVQGRYEVQVLDSYGLASKHDDCGAIYEVAAPKVNACKAPTVWQSYDILFTAPRFEAGKKVANARMTVRHNGILIHDDVEIPRDNTRGGLGGEPSQPGPLFLQDHHGDPVQYRNIWMVPVPAKP